MLTRNTKNYFRVQLQNDWQIPKKEKQMRHFLKTNNKTLTILLCRKKRGFVKRNQKFSFLYTCFFIDTIMNKTLNLRSNVQTKSQPSETEICGELNEIEKK